MGSLLAHHPLLLRGVDTVAPSTAKGVAGAPADPRGQRAVHRAHQRRCRLARGVRRAGRGARADRREVLAPAVRRTGPRQVGGVRARRERRRGARGAVRRGRRATSATTRTAAGAVTGTGQFLPLDGRVSDDRQRRIRRAGGRGPRRDGRAGRGCAARCWPRCGPRTPTRSRPSTCSRWRPLPADAGLGRIGTLPAPRAVARPSSPGCAPRCPPRRGEYGRRAIPSRRCRGSRCAAERATRCSTSVAGAGVDAYVTADLRHHPADEHLRRVGRRAGRRRTLGERVSVVRPGGRAAARASSASRCRCGCQPSAPIPGTSREARLMKAEVVTTAFAARAGRARRRAEPARPPAPGTCAEQQRFERRQAEHPRGQRPAGVAAARAGGPRRADREVRDARSTRCGSARTGTARCSTAGAVDAKQLAELQHELETLERRQSSLEDSLLEVMERREELQAEQADELTRDRRAAERAGRRAASPRRGAGARSTQTRHQGVSRRDELAAGLDADLLALYETSAGSRRHRRGPAAGPSVRCVPDRDRPRRAVTDLRRGRRRGAAVPGVRRNPVAGQGLRPVKVIVEADGGSRGNPGPAGYGAVVLVGRSRDGARRAQARRSASPPTTSPSIAV